MDVTCRFDETKYVLKVFNDCYGGGPPLLSKEAKDYMNSMTGSDAERLLLTLEHFGTKEATKKTRGNRFSEFGVCLCPIECSDSFYVTEYDGIEAPHINRDHFLKSLVANHFKDNKFLTEGEYNGYILKSQEVELIDIDLDTPSIGG